MKYLEPAVETIVNDGNYTLHAVSCYGKSLIDILTLIKLSGQSDPDIEILDQKTSSWLSGMIHSCKFKVIDSFERSPGDGFGPWD